MLRAQFCYCNRRYTEPRRQRDTPSAPGYVSGWTGLVRVRMQPPPTQRPHQMAAVPHRPPSRDQAVALLAAAADTGPQALRAAAIVALLLFTGIRVSELTGADVEG